MTQLPLDSIPSVLLDFMNEDHKEATHQINALHATLEKIQQTQIEDRETVAQMLTGFYRHNETHFIREQMEMERTGFPAYGCHRGEHERVLEELSSVISEWHNGMTTAALDQYLSSTVTPWFINHINTMDTVTAMFVSRHPPLS